HAMLALASVPTAVGDIPHLLRVSAPEHLVHEPLIVARVIARVDTLKPIPVIDKNLFEDTPCRQRCCYHQTASLWGVRLYVVGLSTTFSSPNPPQHRPAPGPVLHPPHPCITGT